MSATRECIARSFVYLAEHVLVGFFTKCLNLFLLFHIHCTSHSGKKEHPLSSSRDGTTTQRQFHPCLAWQTNNKVTVPDHPAQFASSLVLTKHQKEAFWGLWLSDLPEFKSTVSFLHLMRFPLPPGVRRISLLKNMQLSWSNSLCIIHMQKEWLCCFSLCVDYINCLKLFYLNSFCLYMFMYFFCYLY